MILLLLIVSMTAALWIAERTKPTTPIGWSAVMRLIADMQRQAEGIPLTATRINDEDERKIGVEMADRYGLTTRALQPESLQIQTYFNRVGGKVARSVNRPGIPYRFYFDENAAFVDAYSLPGGHIVLGKGLLDLMVSEDELAMVLGHEIAHVDRRHCVERLQYEVVARKLHMELPYWFASLPVAVFQAGYSKELEFEADRLGVAYAVNQGYSPDAFVALFLRMRKRLDEAEHPLANPGQEVGQVLTTGLTEYFRSHPPTADRIAEVDREIREHHWTSHAPQPLQNPSGP